MFGKLPKLSKSLEAALVGITQRDPAPTKGKRTFQRRPTLGRRGGFNQPDYGPTELEARAAQDVVGTLPERIVIKELRRRDEQFEFESATTGGKLVINGIFVDIIIYSRTPNVVLDIASDWNRFPLGDPNEEAVKLAQLEAMGFRYGMLNDELDIFPSAQRLEQRLDEILGQRVVLGDNPNGSGGQMGGGLIVIPPSGGGLGQGGLGLGTGGGGGDLGPGTEGGGGGGGLGLGIGGGGEGLSLGTGGGGEGLGLGTGGGGGSIGLETSVSKEDEIMAMAEIAKLRGELTTLRSLIDSHGYRHQPGGTDLVVPAPAGRSPFLYIMSDPQRYTWTYEDFFWDSGSTAWANGWLETIVGSGAVTTPIAGVRNGQMDFECGSSTNGLCLLRHGPARLGYTITQEPYMEGIAAITSALGTLSIRRIGFAADYTLNTPLDIIGFEQIGTGNWQAVTSNGGGANVTKTDLGIAGGLGTFYRFVIKVIRAGSVVQFEMWNNSSPSSMLKAVQHTANIPTAAFDFGAYSANGGDGAATRNLRVDYIWGHQYRKVGGVV